MITMTCAAYPIHSMGALGGTEETGGVRRLESLISVVEDPRLDHAPMDNLAALLQALIFHLNKEASISLCCCCIMLSLMTWVTVAETQ